MMFTRRSFLGKMGLAVTGTGLASRSAAITIPLSRSDVGRSSKLPESLFPDPMDVVTLRDLATHAVDAARSAGATYADIRVAEVQKLGLKHELGWSASRAELDVSFQFGIRVLMDGAWTFAHGTVPSKDAIARTARSAVDTARGYARFTTVRSELTAMPPVIGEWTAPVQTDPFRVSFQDQTALMDAYANAAARVRNGSPTERWGQITEFNWRREVRVFASTEGALTTQTRWLSEPLVFASGNVGAGVVTLRLPHLCASTGGYETVAKPGLQEQIKALAEDAVRMSSYRRKLMDVGRYSVVMDGTTLGMIMARVLGPALELDRVLGEEGGASGTSFLSPPGAMVGTAIATPLFNVTGHRTAPAASAVKWDDDGVETRPISVVERGKLVNYFGSRRTVSTFHARGGSSATPHSGVPGFAVAGDAGDPVCVRAPHLVVAPGQASASVDDLCKAVSHGVLIREASWIVADQQLSSASLNGSCEAFEIRNGRIVARLDGNDIQFSVVRLLKSIEALGDKTTVRDSAFRNAKGMPWRWATQTATAPAALLRDVNVVSLKVKGS